MKKMLSLVLTTKKYLIFAINIVSILSSVNCVTVTFGTVVLAVAHKIYVVAADLKLISKAIWYHNQANDLWPDQNGQHPIQPTDCCNF